VSRMKRRDFLRKTLSATAGSAMFAALAGKLEIASAAVRQLSGAGSDYRALVCVFLYGGNDAFNMLVPRSASQYATYAASRATLALPQAGLLPLTPLAPASDGADYGLHPRMSALQNLFNTGRAAVVANVGPLLYPITKAQYQNESVPTPAQLFSHSDQSVLWQTPRGDATTRLGWGGRLADLFHASNVNQQLSMNISLNDDNVFQAGETILPYFMSPSGTEDVWPITSEPWNAQRRATFLALRDAAQPHAMQRAYAGIVRRSMANHEMVSAALAGAPALATPFPDTYLGNQLRMIARLISVRSTLQMTRQIFFVGIGGFDTHATQLTDHANVLGEVSDAMAAFYNATVELAVDSDVTAFTASDFGRTLSINGDGTDHGWGGHHVVVGSAVNGRRYYGTMPSLQREGPDDADWGQVIPTTSVDQYAATLAKWYGLSDTDRADVFPNLGRFATPDLGFMA
jgi:uncharacterized protein (DUF1501 family)